MVNLITTNWKIENIETIIFDKDGTLIDLHYFWGKMTELRALATIKSFNLNKKIFEELCLILGYNSALKKMLPDGITALYSRSKIIDIYKENLKKFNIKTETKNIEDIFDEVSETFYKDISLYTKPIPEASDFIQKLYSKGIKLGIVTSDSIISTNLTLKQYNWEKFFKIAIGRESHPDTKESGKPTLYALEKLKANPKTTIMIGDAPTDFISAKKAGIEKTILVSTGQISENQLKKITPYTTNSLNNILIGD